jgi:cytochrome oxidase Cu insertion factor (SCO1/SenC/PrrC family)
MMNRFFSYSVAVLVVVGVIIAAFVISNEMFGGRSGGNSTVVAGASQIGGAFTLTNNKGEAVSDEDYKGKLMLVFFGYTFCPDVCPTELNVMAQVVQGLGADAKEVAPVFITVDPERDTVAVLNDYVQAFDPSIIGLTGTNEQITSVKKLYRAYGQAVDKDKDPEFYLVDHTSFTYLMGRDGKLVTVFSYGTKPEEIISKIEEIL